MRRPQLILGLTFGLCALGIGVTLGARADDSDIHSARWSQLKTHLFGDRSIQDGPSGIIQIEVPLRPDNAAAVPIAVKSAIPQSPDRYVKNVFIVVDNNPEPLVGTFHLTPDSGLADLATNIRVQTHSSVRAIAELNTGELFMSSKFVKATGGCTAVPAPTKATASSNLGQMLIRAQSDGALNQPNWVQLVITHPNHSGLQYDFLTGLPISAHFITSLTVKYGDSTILTAETGISLSEDPSFRFYFVRRARGAVKAEVEDSRELTFTKTMDVVPQ